VTLDDRLTLEGNALAPAGQVFGELLFEGHGRDSVLPGPRAAADGRYLGATQGCVN
jgi:hypothetical protein